VVLKLIYCSPAWSGLAAASKAEIGLTPPSSGVNAAATAPTKSKRLTNYSPMLIKLYSSKCWLIRTTHFTNFFHQLTITITILENDVIITNLLQNEQFSNRQTSLFVRYSVTLIKLLNKFKCSLSAYYVSVYCYSVYF